MIHPTAVISPKAELAANVEIGPYCVIEDHVSIGAGSKLHAHVVVSGHTTIGKDNEFFPFAAIGQKTQDLKYKDEPTYLHIGHRNTFRENTTIHRGTQEDSPTTIHNDNLFLAYAHVAHDCTIDSHTIFSNNASVAGHCHIEDYVIISGLSGVHQFCRVGAHAIIGGLTKVVQDVPPFMIADGNPVTLRGVNQIGLQRRGFSDDSVKAIKQVYKKLFLKKNANLNSALEELKNDDLSKDPHVTQILNLLDNSTRGITR